MTLSSKASLREASLKQRQSVSPKDHAMLSAACCRRLCEFIDSLSATPASVAGYSAVRGELDVSQALANLAERHTLALPIASPPAKILSFRRYHRHDILVRGALGINEPPKENEVVAPAVVIVPLLAFDRSGHRLGYGAGYYDMTLAALKASKPILAIGVAFAAQEVESLPAEAFDQKLDMVVTEKEVIRSP